MTRRLLNLLTALSLALCVAACVLWAWNRYRTAQVRFAGTWREVHAGARPYGVYLSAAWLHTPQRPAGWAFGTYSVKPQDNTSGFAGPGHWSFLGLGAGWFPGAARSQAPCIVRYAVVPHWLVAAAAALMPARWLWRQERLLGRRKKGACTSCGYDLRATPGRCPECGTL